MFTPVEKFGIPVIAGDQIILPRVGKKLEDQLINMGVQFAKIDIKGLNIGMIQKKFIVKFIYTVPFWVFLIPFPERRKSRIAKEIKRVFSEVYKELLEEFMG
jgi:hypothetical protein